MLGSVVGYDTGPELVPLVTEGMWELDDEVVQSNTPSFLRSPSSSEILFNC